MDSEIFDKTSCSFCGKPKDKVKTLVAGPNGLYICDECVDQMNQEEMTKEFCFTQNDIEDSLRETLYTNYSRRFKD